MQYFIDQGEAVALSEGKVVNKMRSGDYIGEIAFLVTCMNFLKEEWCCHSASKTVDVEAVTRCRMLEISVRDFLKVFQSVSLRNFKFFRQV